MKRNFSEIVDVARNSIGTITVKGLGMLVQVILFPLYISYFGDKTLAGIWLTIISILLWINFCDFGVGQGLRNELSVAFAIDDSKLQKELISTAYCVTSLIVCALIIIEGIVLHSVSFADIFSLSDEIISPDRFNFGMKIVIWGATVQIFFNLINYILYAKQKPVIANSMSLLTSIALIFSLFFSDASLNIGDKFVLLCFEYAFFLNLPSIIFSVVLFLTRFKSIAPSFGSVTKNRIRSICSIGGVIFWLQIIWVVISRTNEILITKLDSANSVIEYQAYSKIFNVLGSFIIAAFVPIWSATTKAVAEGKYLWVKRIYKRMLQIVLCSGLVEIVLFLFMQKIIDIWLGVESFPVNYVNMIAVFVCNWIFVLHSANTNISNGMSNFKLQVICMTTAAVLDIPLSVFLSRRFNSWIGVVLANSIVLLIYEILQIVDTERKLNQSIDSTMQVNGDEH